jgi:DNA-binding response OmpR family regulator
MKLFCISQESSITSLISETAKEENWQFHVMSERTPVMETVREFDPDLILVDVTTLADLQWWNEQGISNQKPVIFLNSEITEEFLSLAFEIGADGLLPKKWLSARSLKARVNAYLRRKALVDSRKFVPRLSLVLDSQRYKVEVRGRQLSLTLTEFKILRALATEQSLIVSRKELQTEAFNADQISKRSLDVHICSLRKKLAPQGLDIASVRGVGYRLNPCAS